jgi:hypothetical protein
MNTVAVSRNPTPLLSRPALSIGLSFLLMGLGYAFPLRLVAHAPEKMWAGQMAPEILNLYALTAWMGQAHFFFAFRGQAKALAKQPERSVIFYALVGLTLLELVGLRALIGVGLFSALVWIYFIAHFARSERVFQASQTDGVQSVTLAYYQPVLAFAWLTLVLFNVGHLDAHSWLLLAVTLALAAAVLALGGWKALSSGNARFTVLALFLLGECLVWGAYGHYMTPAFRVGVYVFHIAAASYFHYLGSYFFGRARTGDPLLHPAAIVGVNLAFITLGWASGFFAWLRWLTPLLGIEWFTLWVAIHLIASDLFPRLRRMAI